MSKIEVGREIERFLAKHSGVTLKLPSGWIGRPFDFSCRVTELHCAEDYLAIAFHGPFLLVLTGPVVPTHRLDDDGGASLVLSGFDVAFWSGLRQGAVDISPNLFTEGAVELISTLRG